ncbi:MAG: KpsF/GutQ family sugar-phosphate isomerase [Phycisphaeraceae bacterium]
MRETARPSTSEARPEDQAAFARRVLEAEAEAIRRVTIDASFPRAAELVCGLADRSGTLVVSGLGKSGLIGRKLSATFASTGTPSHFLHPTEAMHGDLGRIRRDDGVLLLSYGGNTEEVVALAELLRQDGVPMIALVGQAGCDLARLAEVTLTVGDVTEACPLNLAPTASTSAMLALGDALALSVARLRNFAEDDFRKLHPGGGLGRQLMPVMNAMRFKAGQNLPLIAQSVTVEQAYAEAERHAQASGLRRAGALLIVDETGKLAGIVTDGDLRTAFIKQGSDVWQGPITAIMTRNPTTLAHTALVREAVRIVREHRFDEIPVVDDAGKPVGLIDVQDLAALKVIEG